jgi:hypothetical protein
MEAQNLWGDLGLEELIRTPVDILKEQANLLSTLTKGILFGDIKINKGTAGEIYLEMSIVAPAMDNYRFNVLDIKHGLELYPAIVVQPNSNRKKNRVPKRRGINGCTGRYPWIGTGPPSNTLIGCTKQGNLAV